MAEGLFRKMIKARRDLEVSSAGISAASGFPASANSIAALRPLGADLSRFRSQPLTEALVQEADYIFAMTRGHLDVVLTFFPEAADKTFLVTEFQSGPERGRDIPDPIGQGLDVYIQCRDRIKAALPSILNFINQNKPKHQPKPMNTPTTTTHSTQPLRIAIAADHGGFELKKAIHAHLSAKGSLVADFGVFTPESVDYPDFAAVVCNELIAGKADFGILVCTSGIGMTIAANRYPQIRAALVDNAEDAAITRLHNNANVLCLKGKGASLETAKKIVDTFLGSTFEGGNRHERRVCKLSHVGAEFQAGGSIAKVDPEIAKAIAQEGARQFENIELIASENFTSRAVMEAQGSCLTNKYAEGYPGKRWYGGCEHVDVVEQLAIDRAKALFGAEHANVQPHSGSQANMAVYFSVLTPGDRILAMDLAHGGHLTHGHKANFSGRFFEVKSYGVSPETETIDYDALAVQTAEFKPKMLVVGASAYPRVFDFKRMREIADSVGAMLFVDMAHVAGLVAGGMHPSPVPHADFVTTTTHKSLRGPRGGIILCKEQYAKGVDSQVFPGIQGGPLMHVVAGKAVCLYEALQPGFKVYAQQIVNNAKALAAQLTHHGYRLVSGGTDNHLMLVDLRTKGLNGKVASETLDKAGITVNKNGIPFDTEKITLTGGIRIGTPAVTTRGMKEEQMMQIADLIHEALSNKDNEAVLAKVRGSVQELTRHYPLPR